MIKLRPIADFRQDTSGSVAILFGLTLIVMLGTAGMTIDFARSLTYQSRTQAALDSAALTATKALVEENATDAQVKEIAERYFNQAVSGLGGSYASHDEPLVIIDRDAGSVKIRVKAKVDTTISRLLKVEAIKLDVSSTAQFATKDIELGVMLDVSGSMRGSKIADLKKAGNDLFDMLLDHVAPGRKVRIGLAPYSTALNAGIYAEKAKGNSGPKGNKCVSERRGPNAFTDLPPDNGSNQIGGKAVSCPVNTVLAITDDKAALSHSLNGYVADGSTAGHLGIAWAWYLVSPKWNNFWPGESTPEEPDPKKLVKAVVIMTDGMFNVEYEKANGTSAEQAAKLCTAMKGEGISVFTVGFQVPNEVKPLLKNCASRPEYAFTAGDGAALRRSFAKIGQALNDLRLSD